MRAGLIALAALVLTACSQAGGAVYQSPIAEAKQILLTTGLPPQVFGSEDPAWEVREEGSDVVWIIKRDGAELFRYTAHLKEEGSGATRVNVELKGAEGDIAKRLADHPEIKSMYEVAVTERIASALEHREFEMSRVYPSMMAATTANMGSIRASADEAAAASDKEARHNIAKAYADEAAGRR